MIHQNKENKKKLLLINLWKIYLLIIINFTLNTINKTCTFIIKEDPDQAKNDSPGTHIEAANNKLKSEKVNQKRKNFEN